MADYHQYSDLELSALLKEGDHRAYTEIYNRFKAPLYVHAYNKIRNTSTFIQKTKGIFQ